MKVYESICQWVIEKKVVDIIDEHIKLETEDGVKGLQDLKLTLLNKKEKIYGSKS